MSSLTDSLYTEHMVMQDERHEALRLLCPDLDPELVRDFAFRMDPEYFERFTETEIRRHLTLAARLDLDHPCQVAITTEGNGNFNIAVVAYDYFSEFAAICGLLSVYGLDIREGRIYTLSDAPSRGTTRSLRPFPRPSSRPGLQRKKIVDVFQVRQFSDRPFSDERQKEFTSELWAIVHHLDAQRFAEARRFVNRRLAETLGRHRTSMPGLLYPIEIHFDNSGGQTDTIVDIRSTDTPAFLYALANALAMRGIYIHKAQLGQQDREVRDRFWIRGRHGKQIVSMHEQQELRVTAALIKQFTHFLGCAPDPAKAMEHFDLFLDLILKETQGAGSAKALSFLRKKETMTLLARLLGTSDYLWEDFLRRQHTNLLPVLNEYQKSPLIRSRVQLTRDLARRIRRARSDDRKRLILNQFKDRELFRIDMVHLMDRSTTLPDFSRALAELADIVLGQAMRDVSTGLAKTFGRPRLEIGVPCRMAVFGLGKFGGIEMGYASDIEVLFVYDGPGRTTGRNRIDNSEYFERLVQGILQRIDAKQEGIFHLDVRLRPHGSKGLLANPLAEIRDYYSYTGLAAPFERQALIKLRFAAGDLRLGRSVLAHRDAYVYADQPWDLSAALDLRRQQIKELADPSTINVKHSPGGLIDVEYAVQYLQLMHGHRHPSVQMTNTLGALAALETAGFLTAIEHQTLREAYLFLRGVIDGLRIVRGHAKDLVLPREDSEEFVYLARRMGYQTDSWKEGASQLKREIQRHMAEARTFFVTRFADDHYAKHMRYSSN